MAVSAVVYTLALQSLANKQIDFVPTSDTIKCMLVKSTYTPNRDTHQYVSDLGSNESSGTGYTAGGVTLTTVSATVSASTHSILFSADDPTWASTTIADARYAVFYVDTGSAATSPLISYIDFGITQSTSSQPFAISLANGIFKLTAT